MLFLSCLTPLLLSASALAQPEAQPLDQALKAARDEQASAQSETARLEGIADKARNEAQRFQAQQAAAAQGIEAAEAGIPLPKCNSASLRLTLLPIASAWRKSRGRFRRCWRGSRFRRSVPRCWHWWMEVVEPTNSSRSECCSIRPCRRSAPGRVPSRRSSRKGRGWREVPRMLAPSSCAAVRSSWASANSSLRYSDAPSSSRSLLAAKRWVPGTLQLPRGSSLSSFGTRHLAIGLRAISPASSLQRCQRRPGRLLLPDRNRNRRSATSCLQRPRFSRASARSTTAASARAGSVLPRVAEPRSAFLRTESSASLGLSAITTGY